MGTNVKSKFSLRSVYHKNSLITSLLCVLLISSLFVTLFAVDAKGQSTKYVDTETTLWASVSNIVDDVPVNITLDQTLGLTGEALIIPANKDIALRSNGNAEFELFDASGTFGTSIITAAIQSVLTLADIAITHKSMALGTGVNIYLGGDSGNNDGQSNENNRQLVTNNDALDTNDSQSNTNNDPLNSSISSLLDTITIIAKRASTILGVIISFWIVIFLVVWAMITSWLGL